MKRKSEYPEVFEQVELKKVKGAKKSVLCKFLFISSTPHTRIIQPSFRLPRSVQVQNSAEIISMMLPQADVKTFSITLEEQDFKTVLKEKLEILGLTKEKKQKKQETLMEEEKEIKFLESEYKTKESLVLLLKEHNFSHQEISKTLNLTKNQIRYLLRKNEEGKDLNRLEKTRTRKITQSMKDVLEKFLENPNNRISTLAQMKQVIINACGLDPKAISIYCVRELLNLLRFSRKRVVKQYIQRNIPRVIQRRFEVAQKILEYLNKNVEFIYIDETGFNQNFSPFYSYSKKGEKSIIKTPPKGDNYSVIAAITSKKFLSYQIFHGSIKADDFGGFVTKIFTEIPELKNKRLNYVIFLDNASIHRANILKPYLRKYHVIYNAPYSPFLNPIEELFGIWKYNFRNLVFDKSKNVVQKITESCTNLDLESISSYFIHSIEFLDDCINKNPIE